MGSLGFYWVLPSFIGLYRVLLGFTGFYWVWIVFFLGFTGFYLVSLVFTGFCPIPRFRWHIGDNRVGCHWQPSSNTCKFLDFFLESKGLWDASEGGQALDKSCQGFNGMSGMLAGILGGDAFVVSRYTSSLFSSLVKRYGTVPKQWGTTRWSAARSSNRLQENSIKKKKVEPSIQLDRNPPASAPKSRLSPESMEPYGETR